MAKKGSKSRKKEIRVRCSSCGAEQDLFAGAKCRNCGNQILSAEDQESVSIIQPLVHDLEDVLRSLDKLPKGANPYQPLDKAKSLASRLRPYRQFFGLDNYLKRVRADLQPYMVSVYRRTLRANVIVLAVLALFPLLPLLLDWPPLVLGFMTLPAVIWAGVTLKAWLDLKKVLQKGPGQPS